MYPVEKGAGFIDYFLDRITMYRLVLYYLIVLWCYGFILSIFGIFPYPPFAFSLLTILLLCVSWIVNKVFSYAFNAPTNVESVYISALIFALIVTPTSLLQIVISIVWMTVWAMASKYMFAIGKKHIFNPVAIAVVITTFSIGQSASWWVGNVWMMPAVVIGGLLIVRKIKRVSMVFTFFLTALLTSFAFAVIKNGDLLSTLNTMILNTPLLFFAFVMLTEPLTTPPSKTLQIFYGELVGILFVPQIQIFGIGSTPELALVVGNIFSYLVSPKQKLMLFLQQKLSASSNVIDFLFRPSKKFAFIPGQYLEWTLPHARTDSRGNRRYFTIASSPTEEQLRLGVRFYEKGSSFKRALYYLNQQTPVVGAQLAGDFVLPKNPEQKIVFIAGGIGVTPYRSMIKFLLDTKQKRQITLLYSNKNASEIAYHDVFSHAQLNLGVKVVYVLTDKDSIPSGWQGRVGRVDAAMIREEVPDYMQRLFYLSGPQSMIDANKKALKDMGVRSGNIKIDYFPGLV